MIAPNGALVPLPLPVAVPFVLALICIVALGAGGTLHVARGSTPMRFLLWGATAGLLLLLLFRGGYGLREFLLPSLVLAIVASFLAQRVDQARQPAATP